MGAGLSRFESAEITVHVAVLGWLLVPDRGLDRHDSLDKVEVFARSLVLVREVLGVVHKEGCPR